MTSRTLNSRQVEILTWVGAGCPDRVWPDNAHRTSARALASRGLVTIRGRGPTWAVTITDAGRAFLEDGDASLPDSKELKRRARDQNSAHAITPQSLLAALVAGDGTHTVSDPSRNVRSAYRRAIAALSQQDLPPGARVTHKGRDRGDLVIKIVEASQASPQPAELSIPTVLDLNLEVIKALKQRLQGVKVAAASQERVLLLHQALALEADRRGYACTIPADGPTLIIRIGEVDAEFSIHEEKVRVQKVVSEETTAVRYDWQRAPLQSVEEWSGRLRLTLQDGWNPSWWADRKHGTLDSRLSQALHVAEKWADQVRQSRETANLARQERNRLWEVAVVKAKAAYLGALNRERMNAQVVAFTHVAGLRSYAAALEAAISDLSDEQRDQASDWVSWIRADADRQDPLMRFDQLRFERPDELPTREVDRFMPRGMTSYQPPA